MKCINCDSIDASDFFSEHIPCSHCDETTELVYSACPDCNIVWKSVNGVAIHNSLESAREIDEFFDAHTDPEMHDFLNDAFKDFMEITGNSRTMNELIHRCLRCETISYEVRPRFYHCPECNFEWEVL